MYYSITNKQFGLDSEINLVPKEEGLVLSEAEKTK